MQDISLPFEWLERRTYRRSPKVEVTVKPRATIAVERRRLCGKASGACSVGIHSSSEIRGAVVCPFLFRLDPDSRFHDLPPRPPSSSTFAASTLSTTTSTMSDLDADLYGGVYGDAGAAYVLTPYVSQIFTVTTIPSTLLPLMNQRP